MAMTLRLSDEMDRELAKLAEATGVSKHEAVVRAIAESAERRLHHDRVSAASARGREKYADLLARLAE